MGIFIPFWAYICGKIEAQQGGAVGQGYWGENTKNMASAVEAISGCHALGIKRVPLLVSHDWEMHSGSERASDGAHATQQSNWRL